MGSTPGSPCTTVRGSIFSKWTKTTSGNESKEEQWANMGEHVEGGVHMEKYVLGRTISCQCVGESEDHRSWNLPVEGFRNHVATDVPLLGVSGR